ncbi:hypothetical protein FPQ18DRAFT_294682 [Pyronema domesticum]|nr:hypothetical protein FPQ18DRAFT_294682 [Pyronema domesticum]
MAPAPVMSVLNSWAVFTPREKRNITVYILGIMLYKFGLEAFNGSIIALATNRYDYAGSTNTLERIGLLTGLNQAFQCVGSILIAPLVRRYPTKVVLSSAIFLFGICTAILLIVDAGTGGKMVPKGWHKKHGDNNFDYYGDYNTDAIIPIYSVAGIVYGMVELIRRIVPRDIVGGNVQKLRRMDALVHIFYEVSGTAGAFCTALALIPRFGNNFSFIISPIFFGAASAVWFFLDIDFTQEYNGNLEGKPSYIRSVLSGAILFFDSVWTGGKILFSSRKFIWLLPGYSIALYAHRYLENGIAPQVAKRYLGHSAWAQIIVGGSNFGELLGALFVFLYTNFVKTPVPWLRIDALMLLIVWYIPYWRPPTGRVQDAWMVAATFIPLSFGWAAGDVSLAAYIQAALARMEGNTRNVSSLGAVMAFLYSVYIVTYAVTSPLLGKYLDGVYNSTGGNKGGGEIRTGLTMTAGVQFTIISVMILTATMVPNGAWALNPESLFNEDLDNEIAEKDEKALDEEDEALPVVVN